jgi:hypothetical protein
MFPFAPRHGFDLHPAFRGTGTLHATRAVKELDPDAPERDELVRRFNEENNVEPAEHWIPRDAADLMAKLIFLPIVPLNVTAASLWDMEFTVSAPAALNA